MTGKYNIIEEGKARIKVPIESRISRKLPVFYNPVMKFNRDMSVLLLKAVSDKSLRIALPLAGTGVRGIRLLKELRKGKIKQIIINDHSKEAFRIIKSNLRLNKAKACAENLDANALLLKDSGGFDHIDIDPFGTPNPFLNNAVQRLSRNGILAVTATDTSALCGSFENACKRKYWAIPLHNYLMQEAGLRILIRKIQLIASQFDKALTPIFSYSKDHYMRVFLRCKKGKQEVDRILKQHSTFRNAGPMWLGKLWDRKLVKKMLSLCKDETSRKFLNIIYNESAMNKPGFHDIHNLCKTKKIHNIPSFDIIMKKIRNQGNTASRTHFNPNGIRSYISEEKLVRMIK